MRYQAEYHAAVFRVRETAGDLGRLVEAHDVIDAIVLWREHMAQETGHDYSRVTPEEVEHVAGEPVLRREQRCDDCILEKAFQKLLRLLAVQAWRHWNTSLAAASKSPYGRLMHAELDNPRVGDIVVEQSTIYVEGKDPIRAGQLLRIEAAPLDDPDWNEQDDGPRPTVQTYVLESLVDGSEMRWTNCSFVKVLVDRSDEVVRECVASLRGLKR